MTQYSTVAAEQPASTASSAEQQRAARDARLAALERRGMGAPSAAAPKAAGETAGLARSSAEPKGQMGDGQTKDDRARERQAILARLKDDEEDQLIRRPARIEATSTQAAKTETGGVRLQIRCPVSKRIHLAAGFAEASLLGEVLASAAAELAVEEPYLVLGYPPFSQFTVDDCKKTLKELGLCPSATLLIKSAVAVVEAPGDDVAAAVPQAAAADDSAPAVRPCPKGHAMTRLPAPAGGWCDMCDKTPAEGSEAFQCKQCDFIVCQECSKLSKS